jgi:hypothetical protein
MPTSVSQKMSRLHSTGTVENQCASGVPLGRECRRRSLQAVNDLPKFSRLYRDEEAVTIAP